jgi:hypothetical protein
MGHKCGLSIAQLQPSVHATTAELGGRFKPKPGIERPYRSPFGVAGAALPSAPMAVGLHAMIFVTKPGAEACRKYRETNLRPHHVPNWLAAV